jgi:hypothetical protein
MPASLDTNQKTLDAINKSIKEQTRILAAPPKKDVEGEREKKDANASFLKELKGIIGAAVGGAGKAGKGAGKMLAKFLKFGLTAIMLPFLGLIGAIAGIISGIMKTPEVKFLGGILKTIGQSAVAFIKFVGNIAKWMLGLGNSKTVAKIGKMFSGLGKSMSAMFGGWGEKITKLLANPKIAGVMGKVSKFIRPLMRIGFWLFAGYEFLKGWGKADQIFGKAEGDATLVEKFAGGIGGFIDFLSFGFISTEKAAKAFKTTFDAFELLITNPAQAWKNINEWWEKFSFNDTIVKPMVEMFDNFPATVEKFIDGPLSNFGSNVATMLKDFVFGKKENAEDAKSGGIVGLIKGMFTAKNMSNAIEGFAKMTAGFYKMVGKLALIPLFGTGKIQWTKPESWGGLFGWLVQRFINIESEGDALIMGAADMVTGIAKWIKNIFWHTDGESGLIQKALGWINENFLKVHFPDVDFAQGIKDMLRPILEKMAKVGLAPASLSEWVGLPKPKPIIKEGPAAPTQVQKGLLNRIKAQEKKLADKDTHRGSDTDGSMWQGKARKDIIADLQKELAATGYDDDYIKPLHKGGGFVMDKNQTRESSLTGQSSDAQAKMAILGSMFSDKVRITSGYRSADRSNKAMLGSKDDMTKYKSKWRNLLSKQEKEQGLAEGTLLKSKPGTKEREAAIKAMRDGGFGSQHEHGNAIDFAYPKGFSKDNFGDLKATLLGAFPGAKIVGESDHVHMAFNKKNTGQQLAQMQIDAGTIGRAGGGGSGGSGGNSINNVTTNNSGTSFLTPTDAFDKHNADLANKRG